MFDLHIQIIPCISNLLHGNYDTEPLNSRTFLCSTALLHTATEFLQQVVDDSELCYDSDTQAWLGMNSDSNKALDGRTYGSRSLPLVLSQRDRQETPPPARLLVNHVLVHHLLSGKGLQLDASPSPPSHSLPAAPSPCRLYAEKSCSPCSLSVSTSNSNDGTQLRNATSTSLVRAFEKLEYPASSGDAAETERDDAKERESLMTNDAAVLRVMVAELSKCLSLCMQQLADARAETRAQTALLHSLQLKTQQDAVLLKARHEETKNVQEDAAEAGQLLTQLTRAVQR